MFINKKCKNISQKSRIAGITNKKEKNKPAIEDKVRKKNKVIKSEEIKNNIEEIKE